MSRQLHEELKRLNEIRLLEVMNIGGIYLVANGNFDRGFQKQAEVRKDKH
jgi:hypothetical protein